MSASFPHLFAPGRIGTRTLRNRILMAPMEKNLATAAGGVTQRYIDYVEARARGGAALILLESMYVDPAGKNHRFQLGLHDDALIPGYSQLTKACHRHGALVGAELAFAGRETSSTVTGARPVAPSPVPCTVLAAGETPRVLTVPEIQRCTERFAEAARRAVAAGFDAVELHGAHGYLLEQFLSPYTNHRTDEYGGDFARRLRFPLEVIQAARDAIGPGVPLLYRLSAEERVEGGLTLEDTCAAVPALEAAGIDLFDVSAGIYESAVWIVPPMEIPPGCFAELSREIRRRVRVPVSVAGRIVDASTAERILEAGDADFVTMGRALHADPDLPRKSREGRLDEICPCVGCLRCSDLLGQNLAVLCLANTHTAREREYAIRPAGRRQRILVVGGGPAGLEVARVAALRDHSVILCERQAEPGGQLQVARSVPGRHELAGIVAYLARAVERAGGEIRLGVEATPELIFREGPDVVVLSAGAHPGIPPIPGIFEAPVVDPFTVLRRPRRGIHHALVIGGGMLGVALAHVLAEAGAVVVVVETGRELCPELGLRPRWQYVATLRARPAVTVHLETTVEVLESDRARLCRQGEVFEVKELDLVVPTWPLLPNDEVGKALAELPDTPPLYTVGDCALPRTAFEAMQEAAALGHRL